MSEEKKPSERYEFVEIPTQMGIVVKDNETDKTMIIDEVTLQILNKVSKIYKATCDSA